MSGQNTGISKEHILAEIRRTAAENGGRPLGRRRFTIATGIRQFDWFGRYWANWGDALREAGFDANPWPASVSDEQVCQALIGLTRELGRFPTRSQRQLKRRRDPKFPGGATFYRFGGTKPLLELLLDYCRNTPGHDDVLALCQPRARLLGVDRQPSDCPLFAYVYLFRSGRFYKIGRSTSPPRRQETIALQLPQQLNIVHTIKTDDAPGIEAYWHKRFNDKRANGEWFTLDREDVRTFKRRSFM